LAALGLARGVESSGKFAPQIKWPNELLLHGKKFCGILAEMFGPPAGSFLVLGVGMNVNRVDFPPELVGLATSLRLESGERIFDRTALAIGLLRALEQAFEPWDAGFDRVIAEVKRRSFLIGKRIRARTGEGMIEGVAQDLGAEGGLIVRRDDGTFLELSSAEEVRVDGK
jgi:BirA family biotin operon repressor/biotin-[acetyl-CoA-carboxylase] ligase